ncbi:MAG: hypothetical protein ACD_60C00149G0012 [uncultured bacterium]|nr:MAG: hypothetical protein ACD_60C00149G0012 [uncultured bacterium]
MVPLNWQLPTPLDAIIFDCDGTLSQIEGIDELAKANGTYDAVKELTAEAMGKSGLNPELYQKRLDLVVPTEKEVHNLGQKYFNYQTEDTSAVIQLLHRINKKIYVISAGLYPAVAIFADLLHIPRQYIFAVNIYFDSKGNFSDYECTSPLTSANGKRSIVSELKKIHPRVAYIGDGLNDYAVYDLATRFIGYGGVYYRENIAALCEFYLKKPTMAGLLPLVLTPAECKKLTRVEEVLYQKGLATIT